MKMYVVVILVLLLCGGAALTTITQEYATLVISAAGGESILATGATTDFNPGIPTGTTALEPKDLMRPNGESTYNGVVLTCYATASENNTCEMALYGIAVDGAPERIADIIWIFGTARHTGSTILWADTCTISEDFHPTEVKASDSGNNFIVKLTFDNIGYRYLYAIAHGTATGEATNITVLMRGY